MGLISTKEVAEKLGVSLRRVQQLITEGALKAQKIGTVYVVDEADLSKVTIHGKAGRPFKKKGDE